MSDTSLAYIARNLAEVLIAFARERRDEDRKRIAALHYELCSEYRKEKQEVVKTE